MSVERITTGSDLPPDLRGISRALDELAGRDRMAAPVALEDRVFLATRSALAAATAPERAPVVVGRIGFVTRTRIAAAIAIGGGLLAVWLGQMHGSAGLTGSGGTLASAANARTESARRMEQDVDLLLAVRSSGTGLEAMGDALDLVQLDAEVIADSLRPDWPSTIDEGAMR